MLLFITEESTKLSNSLYELDGQMTSPCYLVHCDITLYDYLYLSNLILITEESAKLSTSID